MTASPEKCNTGPPDRQDRGHPPKTNNRCLLPDFLVLILDVPSSSGIITCATVELTPLEACAKAWFEASLLRIVFVPTMIGVMGDDGD